MMDLWAELVPAPWLDRKRWRGVDPSAYTAIGYPIFGPRAIRADVAERASSRRNDPRLASLLGCTTREARSIADALG